MSYNSAIANSKFMQIGQKLWVLLAKTQLLNFLTICLGSLIFGITLYSLYKPLMKFRYIVTFIIWFCNCQFKVYANRTKMSVLLAKIQLTNFLTNFLTSFPGSLILRITLCSLYKPHMKCLLIETFIHKILQLPDQSLYKLDL